MEQDNSSNSFLNKIRRMSPGVKASAALFAANIIQKGISYLTTPIYTRMLTTEEYGMATIFFTWQQLFAIVALFCLSYGVFNNGMLDYPDKRDSYSFSLLILSNIITIVFSVILFATLPLTRNYLKLSIPLLVLMIVNFLVQPAYSFWNSRQRYELKYKGMFIWAIIIAVVSPAFSVACILLTRGSRLDARIFGAEGSLIFLYLFFYIYLGKKCGWKLDTSYWKGALLFNLPLIPHYLSTYVLGSADRLMISHLVGDSEAAFYSVAYSVASIAIIVWSSINSSLIPYTYENCKIRNYCSIAKVVQPILVVFALVCGLIILCAPEVVRIMATEEYMQAIYVIPPIIGGVFFQVQYYIYANVVYYYKKPKYVMYASVTAAILNIVLNYIFIKKYGFIAAGYTTIFCYLLQAVMDYFAMKRVVEEPIYDMRFIIGLSLTVIAVALFSNMLYSFTIIRYAIILLFFVAAFLKRKQIAKVFTAIKKS